MIWLILTIAILSLIIGISNYFEIKKMKSGPKQQSSFGKKIQSSIENTKEESVVSADNEFKEMVDGLVAQLPKDIK